jgi:hypothetical protein
MSRQRWLVVAVEVAAQDEHETVYRVRLRAPDQATASHLLYVSQRARRPGSGDAPAAPPYAVGGAAELDPRLLCAVQE